MHKNCDRPLVGNVTMIPMGNPAWISAIYECRGSGAQLDVIVKAPQDRRTPKTHNDFAHTPIR